MLINPAFLNHTPPIRVQSAVLCVLLWVALPLALALPWPVTAWFGCLWLLRLALLQRHVVRVRWPLLAGLMLLSGVLVWQQLGTLFGREGGIAFLLLLLVLKSFEGAARRDWQVLLLALLFLSGGAVLLNQSPAMGLWLLVSLLAVCCCMAMLGGLPLRQAWARGGQALLLTLPLMLLLFVSVPRSSEPLWRVPQQQEQAQTGLSDSMQPGSISNLVQSNEWVANITFADGLQPQPQDLYWRAIIMADFDGVRWRAVPAAAQDSVAAGGGRAVAYQMMVRDQNGVLPALDYPQQPLPAGVSMRLGQTVRADASREGVRRVALLASLGNLLPQRLSAAEHAAYVRLPEGNLRTRLLAEGLSRQAASERQLIDLVLHHYRRNPFVYTLQPPLAEGRDGVDEFMFRTRQGFCEHYAQSFVVMMRAAGVPARVVTGYLGGEYHEAGEFWQLRSRDAHAWAEVWLAEEQAWLRVDPTAAVSSVRAAQGLAAALPQHQRDAVAGGTWQRWGQVGQYYWQQWVVNYDEGRQNSLFAALGLGGFNLKTLWVLLLPGLLLAAWPLLRLWQRGAETDRDELAEGFMLLKTVLLGADDERLAATSATELRAIMAAQGRADAEIEQLLWQYEMWLYGGGNPDRRSRRRWLRQIRRAARRYC